MSSKRWLNVKNPTVDATDPSMISTGVVGILNIRDRYGDIKIINERVNMIETSLLTTVFCHL
jgi:hypothetical protein